MGKEYITYDKDFLIKKYFTDVRKNSNKLLTPEEEVAIAIRIKEGDESAISELVTANLRFVITIAKEYQGQGLSLNDLISEGNYGLLKAASRFDHTKGFKFISYAVHWIKQSIMESLNNKSRMIRLPTNVVNRLYKEKKIKNELNLRNKELPIDGDLIMNKSGELEVFESLKYLPTITSISVPINVDGDELSDLIQGDNKSDIIFEEEDNNKVKRELHKLLSTLNEREREIITLYYGLDSSREAMTLEGIGDKYSLTKERIRQIKEKAIRKLRFSSDDLYDIINE